MATDNLPSSWKPSIAPFCRTRRCTQPLTAVDFRSLLQLFHP
ncbi:hypothetical protein [Rubritalea tangerina]